MKRIVVAALAGLALIAPARAQEIPAINPNSDAKVRSLTSSGTITTPGTVSAGTLTGEGSGVRVAPNGASTSITLGALASGSRYLAKRDYRGYWKPFGGALTEDNSNSTFATNRTYTVAVEAESDYTAVRLHFGSQNANPYTVTSFAVSGSSQWGSILYGTPGISAYDAAGNQVNKWSVGAFANAGADVDTVPVQTVGNCLTTASGSSGTTINLATNPTTAGWVVGQRIAAYTDPAGLAPLTQLASVGTSSVTIDLSPRNALGAGVQVCALPLGMTIPAAPAPPIQTVTMSDWVPVQSVGRIDSPVSAGAGIALADGTSLGIVASLTATQVNLSAPLSAAVAKGTSIGFCSTATTSSALSRQDTFAFSSVPSTVAVGSLVNYGSTEAYYPTLGISNVTVTARTGTAVTVSAPTPYSASGAQMQFSTPMTVTAISGANVTVASVPANVTTGMNVGGTGLPNSYRDGPFFNTGDSITAISGNVLTLSGAPDATLRVGDTIYAVVVLSTAGTLATPQVSISSTPSILPGSWIFGTGIAPGTYAVKPTSTSTGLSQSPATAIASGASLRICNPLTLAKDAPAGSTALVFAKTTYPKPLLLIRINIGSDKTKYWYLSGPVGELYQAAWSNIPGAPRYEASFCGAGNDGVLNTSSIGNLSGGCSHNLNIPIYGIEFKTAARGVIAGVTGDSHFQGYTTTAYGNANYAMRGLAPMSSPNLPIWVANLAQSGKTSETFFSTALNVAKVIRPSVMLLAGWTWNDVYTTSQLTGFLQSLATMQQAALGWGGLPVVVSEHNRAVRGCNSPFNGTGQSLLQQSVAAERQVANDNSLPFFDLFTLTQDPNSSGFLVPAISNDCVHLNDAGHGVAGTALQNLLRPYLAN